MTLSIKVTGASFTNVVGVSGCPSLTEALAFHLFGGNSADSLKNYAGARAAGTAVGAVTYSTGYVSISDTIGIDSGIVGNSPFTHIAVCTVNSGSAIYCGHWAGGVTRNALGKNGVNLGLAVDGGWRANTAMSGAGFHFIAGTHNGTTAKIYRGASGSLTTASGSHTGGTGSTASFRTGANGLASGTFNCAAVLTFNTVLTEVQLLEWYAYLTNLLATRSVTVL